jgi:hypothetical protein
MNIIFIILPLIVTSCANRYSWHYWVYPKEGAWVCLKYYSGENYGIKHLSQTYYETKQEAEDNCK